MTPKPQILRLPHRVLVRVRAGRLRRAGRSRATGNRLAAIGGLLLCAVATGSPGQEGRDAAADAAARALIDRHGCTACHEVPGVAGFRGRTGPPLTAMPRQVYVAGVLPNTPEALAAFIADPQDADPRSAMPDLGVTAEEAALIAAFLLDPPKERAR